MVLPFPDLISQKELSSKKALCFSRFQQMVARWPKGTSGYYKLSQEAYSYSLKNIQLASTIRKVEKNALESENIQNAKVATPALTLISHSYDCRWRGVAQLFISKISRNSPVELYRNAPNYSWDAVDPSDLHS